jgi:hypothetical protein
MTRGRANICVLLAVVFAGPVTGCSTTSSFHDEDRKRLSTFDEVLNDHGERVYVIGTIRGRGKHGPDQLEFASGKVVRLDRSYDEYRGEKVTLHARVLRQDISGLDRSRKDTLLPGVRPGPGVNVAETVTVLVDAKIATVWGRTE